MPETGTNQIVYQAIERTYRSAILAHLRDNFIKHFGREHGQRLRKVLIRIGGESRIGPEERVRITKALGVVNVHPRDAYDHLDVSDFRSVFEQFPAQLIPGLGNDATGRKLTNRILGDLSTVTTLRNAVSHPYEDDLSALDAVLGLGTARRVLNTLELDSKPLDQTLQDLARMFAIPARAETEPRKLDRRRKRVVRKRKAAWGEVPQRDDAFIGREADIDGLVAALKSGGRRLIVLSGSGGTGKTRLLEELLGRRAGELADRFLFVDLSRSTKTSDVAAQVLQHLGGSGRRGEALLDAIVRTIGDRSILLALDNFEHVLRARELLPPMVRKCPHLKVVVTSQRQLDIRELVIRLDPLALPGDFQTPSLENLADRSPAIALLLERAKSAGIAIPDDEGTAAVALCRRLGGLPAAIEQVVPHLRSRTPTEVLEDFNDVIRRRQPGVPARHRTVLDITRYSYLKLGTNGKRILRLLVPFAPSSLVEDIAAVGRTVGLTPEEVSDGIGSLTEWNLITRSRDRRLHWLETVRDFATEAAGAAGELRLVADAHCGHFLAMMEGATAVEFDGDRIVGALPGQEDNIRSAVAWATRDASQDPDRLARLAAAAAWAGSNAMWAVDAAESVWQSLFDLAISPKFKASPAPRASALRAIGRLVLWDESKGGLSGKLWEQALALAEETGDLALAGAACTDLEYWAYISGDIEIAVDANERYLALARRLGTGRQVGLTLTELAAFRFHGSTIGNKAIALAESELLNGWPSRPDDPSSKTDPLDPPNFIATGLRLSDAQVLEKLDPEMWDNSQPPRWVLEQVRAYLQEAVSLLMAAEEPDDARSASVTLAAVHLRLGEISAAVKTLARTSLPYVSSSNPDWLEYDLLPLALRLALRLGWKHLTRQSARRFWSPLLRTVAVRAGDRGDHSVAIRLLAAADTCDETQRSRSFAAWKNNLARLPGPTREIAVDEGAQLWLVQALGYALKNIPDPPKPTPLRLGLRNDNTEA
jgi:AAA domain